MGSELLLYGYGLVCLSMILFNLVQSIVLRQNDKNLTERSRALEQFLALQFEKIHLNEKPKLSRFQAYLPRRYRSRLNRNGKSKSGHFQKLEKRLEQVRYLLAFDRMLDQADITIRNTEFSEYLVELQPILVNLGRTYMKREAVQAAYFAHFLTKHRMIMETSNLGIQNIMVECMNKENLYCRINGMRGICAFGSIEKVIDAIHSIDREDVFFHDKLLTEFLLSFTGDHDQLIRAFWQDIKKFSLTIQVSFMNYIRFKSGAYGQQFYGILIDEKQDKELRLAAIRYFGRYPYLPAEAILLNLLGEENSVHWEYAAIAASSLARYRGVKVVPALIKAMSSTQWYVRFNAASSIKTLKLDYDELIEVVHKGDRYAREMVMYRLLSREREEKDKGERQ